MLLRHNESNLILSVALDSEHFCPFCYDWLFAIHNKNQPHVTKNALVDSKKRYLRSFPLRRQNFWTSETGILNVWNRHFERLKQEFWTPETGILNVWNRNFERLKLEFWTPETGILNVWNRNFERLKLEFWTSETGILNVWNRNFERLKLEFWTSETGILNVFEVKPPPNSQHPPPSPLQPLSLHPPPPQPPSQSPTLHIVQAVRAQCSQKPPFALPLPPGCCPAPHCCHTPPPPGAALPSLRSPHAPSIILKLASLYRGELLTKSTGRLRAIWPMLVGYVDLCSKWTNLFHAIWKE